MVHEILETDISSLTAIACPIESSDKASKKCQSQRQQETAKTREDYELDKGNDYLPIPRIKKNIREVFLLLKKDLLDNHWISLYNQTIYKNFGLFRILVNLTRGKDIDYNKIYKFFVAGQRDPRFVLPVWITLSDSFKHLDNASVFKSSFDSLNHPQLPVYWASCSWLLKFPKGSKLCHVVEELLP